MVLRVTAEDFKERSYSEQLLLRALLISLLLHLLAFGGWRWARASGWNPHFSLPKWMHLSPKLLMPIKPVNLVPPAPPQPAQMVFVDVDPALASVVPPKTAKNYSSANSTAANPHPKHSTKVEITGRQTKELKTTQNIPLKPQPMRPSPAKEKSTEDMAESKPLPKKALAPGDLVMAKPQPKPVTTDGEADTDAKVEQPQQEHHRPRTIAEAMAQHGMIGEKMKQDGGVGALRMDSTLDAVKTSYGDYDRQFIDAVRTRWYQLLEGRMPGTGRVVVEFRLLPDGRITNLQIVHNEMSDLFGLICQQAIFDPAPYRPWPLEMRRDIPNNYRDVSFTFYYSAE
jgi:outer membrane biosynthesis protein TonB